MSELKKNTQMFFDFGSGEENTPEDASLNNDLLSVFEEETPEEIEVVELEDYEEEWADVPVEEAAEKEPQPLPAEASAQSVSGSPAAVQEKEAPAAGKTEEVVEIIQRVPAKKQELSPQTLKRAALAFLAALNPTGLALSVPTRLKKFQADAAAFWSEPASRRGILRVTKTVIVETSFENIISMDCSNRRELTALLSAAKLERCNLEAEIRRTEPHLKEMDTLFVDFDSWDYKRSSNKAYKQCLKRIDELEYALYHGSRLDKIRTAKTASQLYLAVPENTVKPNEIADSWGLIYVMPDLTFRLVKEPETWNCPEENMNHLAQNIAASAMRDVLFSNGIYTDKTGSAPCLGPVPRRRRLNR